MLRFAILEHRWNGLHWDFFLETTEGGPLRSWAIDAPIVANAVLPARTLCDHRAIYLDYEGEVSGGRGTMKRFEAGTYEVEVWRPEKVRVRIRGAQLVGLVELLDVPGLGWTFRLGNFD